MTQEVKKRQQSEANKLTRLIQQDDLLTSSQPQLRPPPQRSISGGVPTAH